MFASQKTLKLTMPKVLAAVQSVYADELKPLGRVLLKRLREQAASAAAAALGLAEDAVDPENMPKIDPKRLRRICQDCPQLQVHPEDGREFFVTLLGRSFNFPDACSAHDPYPTELWLDAVAYFENVSKDNMYLPGGRYACARELAKRQLPFLAGASLGQICHIVQLAISQKRILGYLGGQLGSQLVPYHHSDEWVKEQHAYHQQPISPKKGLSDLPVATWEDARTCMSELLYFESNPEPGVVTLSNVKRLFRSRFQLELSETVLGYSRLFDLLHDVHFSDVCVLQAHKNGQLLVKRVDGPRQVPCHQLDLPSAMDPHYAPQPQLPGAECFGVPVSGAQAAAPEVWSAIYMGSVVYPAASLEANSLPPKLEALRQVEVDIGMDSRWYGLPQPDPCCSQLGAWKDDARSSGKGCDEDSDRSTDVPQSHDLTGYSSEDGRVAWLPSPLALQAEAIRAEEEEDNSVSRRPLKASHGSAACQHFIKNTFIEVALPTKAGAKQRSRSVPRHMGSQVVFLETA